MTAKPSQFQSQLCNLTKVNKLDSLLINMAEGQNEPEAGKIVKPETPKSPDKSVPNRLAETLHFLPPKNVARALASLGIAAATTLSAACDTEMKNLPEIPNIRIENLASRPEQYKDLKELQTVGFPELVGTTRILMPWDGLLGNTDLLTSPRKRDVYALHTAPDSISPSVKMLGEDTKRFSITFTVNALTNRPNRSIDRKIQVIGQIKQGKNDKGEIAYVLDASEIRSGPAESTPRR